MRKLAEVECAKAVMNDGMTWSVVRWLKEKKRVRKIADQANAALDARNAEVKAGWPMELQQAYAALRKGEDAPGADAEAARLLERVLRADEAAHRARMEAEKTFDDAEDQLSARLAREGCSKAIHSWELHELAIRTAEAAAGRASPARGS